VQTRTLDSVVTTEANQLMARIHPRMPVILHSRDDDRWLDREETERLPLDGPELLQQAEAAAVAVVSSQH
jgi:putative SOS response-associated peptidase YedK